MTTFIRRAGQQPRLTDTARTALSSASLNLWDNIYVFIDLLLWLTVLLVRGFVFFL